MIRFFRANDPYRFVFIFLILVAVRTTYGLVGMPLSLPEFKALLLGEWLGSGFNMYSHTFDYTAPLSAWTYKALDVVFGRSRFIHWVLSTILVAFQAWMFNRTLLINKVLSEPTYVPAFLYVVFSVAVFDFFALSPQLLSLTFVILSIDQLVQRLDNVARDELFLYPGFYLGMAGLFYFPANAFFLVFLLAIILLVQAKFRRILLYLYGWISANLMVGVILLLNGNLPDFLSVYLEESMRAKEYFVSLTDLIYWIAFPSVVFFLALFQAIGQREGSLHVKTQQFLLLIFFASVVVIALSGTLAGIDLVFLMPVFTFFLSDYFIKLRHRVWRRVLPSLMIFGSLLVPFLAFRFVLYQEALILQESAGQSEHTKVMVIGPISEAYLTAEIAGPFIDEQVSRDRLEDLDYYHQAPLFLEIFEQARPELILDEWDQMERINNRFPQIEEMRIQTE